MVNTNPKWAFLIRVGPSLPPEDGPRAWELEDPADMHLREVLERIANLAGWSLCVPFDLEDPGHAQALRAAVDQLELDASWLGTLLDGRLASVRNEEKP